jgi:hypothetical protein
MYSFLLTLTKTDAKLVLMKDGGVVAEKSWTESRDLGRQLFEGIDTLLSENDLNPQDVSDFRLETAVSDNFTPLDSHPSDAFWTEKHVSPSIKNPGKEPFLSDLTGLTSVKIAETVAGVYTWAVSEGKLRDTVTLSEAKTDKNESKSDPRLG